MRTKTINKEQDDTKIDAFARKVHTEFNKPPMQHIWEPESGKGIPKEGELLALKCLLDPDKIIIVRVDPSFEPVTVYIK